MWDLRLAFLCAAGAGCSGPPCDGEAQVLKADGNCYILDSGGPVDLAEPWLDDVGVSRGIQDRFRRNRGTAAADFNGDGAVDFFLANPNDPSTLLLNDGSGIFAEQPDAPTTGNDAAVAAADYDNDGDPDLWIACGGWGEACPDALYRNDGPDPLTGQVRFVDVTADAGLSEEARQGFGVAWGDYDADGWLDVFISNKKDWSQGRASSQNQLYRNNGDGTFADVTEDVGLSGSRDSHTAAWLDVEPDGDLDLFVPNLFDRNGLYLNQGNGRFIDSGSATLAEPYQAFGAAAADVNNDGLVDLVVSANSGSEWAPEDRGDQSLVYLNQGGGAFEGLTLAGLLGVGEPVPMRVMGFAVGDLNMDGITDLFFGSGEPASGGRNRLLISEPTAGQGLSYADESVIIDSPAPRDGGSEPYRSYPYRTHGSVIVDVDGDLDNDLFIGNGGMNLMEDQEEPNRLFVSNLSGSINAIALSLKGSVSNRDGVGALVTITAVEESEAVVTHWVMRSSGFNSSLPRRQVIGLGDLTGPLEVEIQWPSGIVQMVEVDGPGRSIEVSEPSE